MINYGISLSGPLLILVIPELKMWTPSDFGCIVKPENEDQYWIGGDDISDGINGWIPIKLLTPMINSNHLDLNLNFDDDIKIDANDIPILFDSDIHVVQDIINILPVQIDNLNSGVLLNDDIIIPRHINFTAVDITYLDTNVAVKLSKLISQFAYNIPFSDTFITKYPNVIDVYNLLISLESNLKTLTAKDISYYDISVYDFLNTFYEDLSKLTFIMLTDTPNDFGVGGQIIKCSSGNLIWSNFSAVEVNCNYPGNIPTNLQSAITEIFNGIEFIKLKYTNYITSSEYIKYTSFGFEDLEAAINSCMTDIFTPSNLMWGEHIKIVGFGDLSNCQNVIDYFDSQLLNIIGMIPCKITAESINFSIGMTLSDAINQLFSKFTLHNHDLVYYSNLILDDKFSEVKDQKYTSVEMIDMFSKLNHGHDDLDFTNIYSIIDSDLIYATTEHTHSCYANCGGVGDIGGTGGTGRTGGIGHIGFIGPSGATGGTGATGDSGRIGYDGNTGYRGNTGGASIGPDFDIPAIENYHYSNSIGLWDYPTLDILPNDYIYLGTVLCPDNISNVFIFTFIIKTISNVHSPLKFYISTTSSTISDNLIYTYYHSNFNTYINAGVLVDIQHTFILDEMISPEQVHLYLKLEQLGPNGSFDIIFSNIQRITLNKG